MLISLKQHLLHSVGPVICLLETIGKVLISRSINTFPLPWAAVRFFLLTPAEQRRAAAPTFLLGSSAITQPRGRCFLNRAGSKDFLIRKNPALFLSNVYLGSQNVQINITDIKILDTDALLLHLRLYQCFSFSGLKLGFTFYSWLKTGTKFENLRKTSRQL